MRARLGTGISASPSRGFRGRASKYIWMRQATPLPPAPGRLSRAPAFPDHAPAVVVARELGLPVLGELELAWRLLPNEFLAVTGTNGKTTTTEWIGHIHRTAGTPVAVAGNVGTAASSLIGRVAPDCTIVCEASSFQLEDTEAFAPEAAVLINVTPDHLDRHRSFEAYVQAKLRIFENQTAGDVAVLPEGLRDALPIEIGELRAEEVTFGQGAEAELREHDGRLWWREEPIIATEELSLPGAHNRQNAMAAAAVCLARGTPPRRGGRWPGEL